MNGYSKRVCLAASGALVSLSVFASGCTFKDQLLQPQQPGIILPDQAQGVAGAEALYVGALARFQSWSVGGNGNQEALWPMIGLATDEYKSADTFSQRNEADQRTVQTNNAQVQSVYTQAQQSRGFTRDAIVALQTSEPAATGKIAEMYFLLGFTEMQLGEVYCNGIPLGITKDGVPNYTNPMLSVDVIKGAIVKFDSALALATGTDAISVNAKNAAAVAKGRALVNIAQYAQAAAAVANVQTAYQYVETFAQTSQDNGFWIMTTSSRRYSVGDSLDGGNLTRNAIPFASAKDPRVPSAKDTFKPFDNQSLPYYVQTMFARNDAIAIVDGLDARLIEAEARLNANDIPGMMTILNNLRASPPTQGIFKAAAMAALPVPATQDAAISLFFREKAFWTFSRGQRFGDLRRLVRNYGRTQDQVWPTGTFFKAAAPFGSDVTYPVTDNEKSNPNFLGCTDRKA